MRSSKLFRTAGTALALGLTLVVGTPAPGFAAGITPLANTTDRGFYFDLEPQGDTGATGWYRKDDNSRVYVNITSREGTHRMYVDGAKNSSGSGWKDCTATTYRARKVGKWSMRNTVRSNGFSYARLSAWAEKTKGHVEGVWSPDSSGSYEEMGD